MEDLFDPHSFSSTPLFLHAPLHKMLIRIVRMTFRPDAIDAFLDQFDRVAPQIRRFPGCEHLELWQDVHFPNCCTTYSQWHNEEALDAYRQSDLFRTTWREVKPLFAARPKAHSSQPLRADEEIAKGSR